MLELILMLLGLAFSNNNANTTSDNNNDHNQVQSTLTVPTVPGDTGGETTQTPPKK